MISYLEPVLVRKATPSRRVESNGLEKGIKIRPIFSILSRIGSAPKKFLRLQVVDGNMVRGSKEIKDIIVGFY